MNQEQRRARQRWYLEERARLRDLQDRGDPTADASLKKLVEAEVAEFPVITGDFTYTQEQADEAKKAGY